MEAGKQLHQMMCPSNVMWQCIQYTTSCYGPSPSSLRWQFHSPGCFAVFTMQITKVEEEEYCLIPMGGVLPTHPQRVLGIGGTAGMVHPSTGFMMGRMLGAAPTIADAIIEQLCRPADKATQATSARRPGGHAWLQ